MKSSQIKRIVIILIILIVVTLAWQLDISQYVNLDTIKENEQFLTDFVDQNYALAVLIHLAAYITNTSFSLPFATPLTLGGGFIFGLVGAIYNILGATMGAMGAFYFSRLVIGESVQNKYGKQLQTFNANIEENAVNYLLFLRLVPAFPFFLVNLLGGLTKVKPFTFFWTTLVGIIPGTFAYTYAGTQLATIESARDIVSLEITSAFILLGVVALIPTIIKKFKKTK